MSYEPYFSWTLIGAIESLLFVALLTGGLATISAGRVMCLLLREKDSLTERMFILFEFVPILVVGSIMVVSVCGALYYVPGNL